LEHALAKRIIAVFGEFIMCAFPYIFHSLAQQLWCAVLEYLFYTHHRFCRNTAFKLIFLLRVSMIILRTLLYPQIYPFFRQKVHIDQTNTVFILCANRQTAPLCNWAPENQQPLFFVIFSVFSFRLRM
jgi:hypothetical protein